ncbi:hypothetical protein LTR85_003457 [Meristemomyces frigidus]|nr:hypothetical protein LTR85_003457 [Meristemomyces frigidus]
MAEPLSILASISVASNLFQIIDFSTKVIAATHKLVTSSDQTTEEVREHGRLAAEYQSIGEQVSIATLSARPMTSYEHAVEALAEECKDEAGRLLDLLKDLKVKEGLHGARRVWHGARQAARSVHQKKRIEARQKLLSALNAQLATSLLSALREDQRSSLESILDRFQQSDADHSAALLDAKQEILHDIRLAESKTTSSVVNSLRFAEMRLRRDAIDHAHRSTYEWIFTHGSSPFREWLESGQGLFWVCGKAGSGKSTLMKFLSKHAETKRILKTWAGNAKLLVADYYFWYLGNAKQKSVGGLLQSMLYQILSVCQELAKIAVPRRCDADSTFQDQPDPWSTEELEEALARLAEADSISHRFCFLIDGLDEYQGDQAKLVRLVKKLSLHRSIKICVSSRPWNIFNWAFEESTQKLRLDTLTKGDIHGYVSDELSDLGQGSEAEALVAAIVEKAQGVFLWVYLVVSSLRSGLIEGDDVATMSERLQGFPSDLEEFFRIMVSRIDPIYKKKTGELLTLAMLLQESRDLPDIPKSSHFLYFWLVGVGVKDSRFAVERDVRFVTCSDLHELALRTRKMLGSACKDLLHMPHFDPFGLTPTGYLEKLQVEFLHKTVYQFMQAEQMRLTFGLQVPANMQSDEFLHHLELALPADLDGYFRLMPSRIDPVYKKTTGQVLQLAILLSEHSTLPHFQYFWHIYQGIKDQHFAVDLDIQPYSASDFSQMAHQTRKFVSATCKDLQHMPTLKRTTADVSYFADKVQVDFLHRTVYDFLATDEMRVLFGLPAPANFTDDGFLCHIDLAKEKMVPVPLDCDRRSRWALQDRTSAGLHGGPITADKAQPAEVHCATSPAALSLPIKLSDETKRVDRYYRASGSGRGWSW